MRISTTRVLLFFWMLFCMIGAAFFTVANAQTLSEDLANPIINPVTGFPGEYDLLRGLARDSQRPDDSCAASGTGTCSDVLFIRMANPSVSGGAFSFDIELRAANPSGVGTDLGMITDPGAAGDRTKLGNVIGDGLAAYLTYNPEALGSSGFVSQCASTNGDLLSVGFGAPPVEANNQPDVGAYTWSNSGAAAGPAAPVFNLGTGTAEPLMMIPSDSFGTLATISCDFASGANVSDLLAQTSFHALSFNTFSQLTGPAGVVENYATAAVNDLINYPLDGTGLYMADAKFAGNNSDIYVYIASADDTPLPSALTAGDFSLARSSSPDVSILSPDSAIPLERDGLGRQVFLLDLGNTSVISDAVQGVDPTSDNPDDYAYVLSYTGSELFTSASAAKQSRTLFPHHPGKPFIESVTVGANSADVTVVFSADVGTNQDGTGALTEADFDVIFHGSQDGSISGVSGSGDEYVLTIEGVDPDNLGSADRIEVRSAETSEDLGYKSLKTIYTSSADATDQREGVYALQGAVANLTGALVNVARFVPNSATAPNIAEEGIDSQIDIFVGRAGETAGALSYTNIALSCGDGGLDSRLGGTLDTSADIPDGQTEVSIGSLTFDDDSVEGNTTTCQITADVGGSSMTLMGTLTLLDDDLVLYTARFDPNTVTESSTLTSVEVFVGREGNSRADLSYSNIALSCGGQDGTTDSSEQDPRLTGTLDASVTILAGDTEASAGSLMFADNQDLDDNVTCQITADIGGAVGVTLEGASSTLSLISDDFVYTARFDPNIAMESATTNIDVFVGREGNSGTDLSYSNIALSCGGQDGTTDSSEQDPRLTGTLDASVTILAGDTEASAGSLMFADNQDLDDNVTCQITADIGGAVGVTLEGASSTLSLINDDTFNDPISIVTAQTDVMFSESVGSAFLDQTAMLIDPHATDEISSMMATLEITGRDNGNLGLRISGSADNPAASLSLLTRLSTPASSQAVRSQDGQDWLRLIEVATVAGKVPPASAKVTVTVVTRLVSGELMSSTPTEYNISVWKDSRVGEGLVANDLEGDIGVDEASDSAQAIQDAVAAYCGSGYYEDFDSDGVPNNVEVAIGTDCTEKHANDFVGTGRPVITVADGTPAFSQAPISLNARQEATCTDPDGGACRIIAYVVGSSDVCTATQIGGAHESACDSAFSSENNLDEFYPASPGLTNVVWLAVGADGDWAHNDNAAGAVDTIAFSSNAYYLAPIISLQFADARASTSVSGWVYAGETAANANVVLPRTHSGATMFQLNATDGTADVLVMPITVDDMSAQNGTVATFKFTVPAVSMNAEDNQFQLSLSGDVISRIATADTWVLGDEDWLYSSLSNAHINQTATVIDAATAGRLNRNIGIRLACGGTDVSFYPADAMCNVRFEVPPESDNVTHWGYYVVRYAATTKTITSSNGVGDGFQLGDTADATNAASENSLGPIAAPTEADTFAVLNIVAAVKDGGNTVAQRGASFPISGATSMADADRDGVADDNTLGDQNEYVNRDTGAQSVLLAVASGSHISLGPHAYSSSFNYDTGADISETRSDDPIVQAALASLPDTVPGIGVYDFYVQSDVAFDGQPVRVAIPLKRGLPDKAGYWIYDGRIWQPLFDGSDDADGRPRPLEVYSALQPCPPVPAPGPVTSASGWTAGLTAGHSCILIELVDDCSVNAGGASGIGDGTPGCGTISDIATISLSDNSGFVRTTRLVEPDPTDGPPTDGIVRRGGGGGSADWLLLSSLLIAAAVASGQFIRRRKTRSNLL